jgi:hypothetical protein
MDDRLATEKKALDTRKNRMLRENIRETVQEGRNGGKEVETTSVERIS